MKKDFYVEVDDKEGMRNTAIYKSGNDDLTENFLFNPDYVVTRCSIWNKQQSTVWWMAFTPDSALLVKNDQNQDNSYVQECHLWQMDQDKKPVSFLYRKDYGVYTDTIDIVSTDDVGMVIKPTTIISDAKAFAARPSLIEKIDNPVLATKAFEDFKLESVVQVADAMAMEKIAVHPFSESVYDEEIYEYTRACTAEQEKFIQFMHGNIDITIAQAFKCYTDLGAQNGLALKK